MDAGDNTKRRVNDLAERYAGSLNRSSGENDMRKDLREKIEELGYSAKAFQPAVAIAKSMTRSEADHYLDSMQFFVEALLGRQGELFPTAVEKINKRITKAQEKAARDGRTQSELDEQTDGSKRSDPNAGGAKPQVDNAAEQAEGEAALAAGLAGTAAAGKAKKSQSAEAAAKREAAKLN